MMCDLLLQGEDEVRSKAWLKLESFFQELVII